MIEDRIKKFTGLCDDHVRSAVGAETGSDIILSKVAKEKFPYSVECKSRKSMAIYKYYEQAKKNSGNLYPLVVCKADRKRPLAIVDLEHLMNLIENSKEEENV